MIAAGFRWTPGDIAKLDATLQEQFEPAQLLSTSCYLTDATGRLRLIDSLRRPDTPVAVIREVPGGEPYAIVASDRPANRPPTELDYFVDDARRLRAEAAGGVWLAVADDHEATEWLRRTNLAAVPISQLSRLPPLVNAFWRSFANQERGASDEMISLRRRLNSRRAAHRHVAHCPTEMDPQWREMAAQVPLDAILVAPAWDCRSFQPLADGGPTQVECLRQLQRAAPDGYGACGVWAPSVKTLERLRSLDRSTRKEPFARGIQYSLAHEIWLLPEERAARPEALNENPNELRRQLYGAQSHEEFTDAKRRYRHAIQESLLTPAATDLDVVGTQRRHVANLLLQQLVDVDLEIALSRDRHPFSTCDRSVSIANLCKLAATWLDVHTARTRGRHARRHR